MNSRLNVELHPLQNVEILSTIFSFCSANDLKNCRLVGSKLWLKASLNSWRKNALLKIKAPQLHGKSSSFYTPKEISFQDFQSLYENEEDPFQLRKKPFKNLSLEHFHRLGSDPEGSWIFDKFSNDISHLTFMLCRFSTWSDLMNIFTKLPNLVEVKLENRLTIVDKNDHDFLGPYAEHQKLKRIIIETGMLECFYQYNSFWFPWESFFKYFPNLEDINIQASPHSRIPESQKEAKLVLKKIASFRRVDDTKLRIKNLAVLSVPMSINGFTDEEDLEALSGMPLERFTGAGGDLVYLKPYSETLKYLRLTVTYVIDAKGKIGELSEEKVSLPHLKEFYADGLAKHVFQNLDKLEAKNLEKLVVEDLIRFSFYVFKKENPRDYRGSPKIRIKNSSFGNVTTFECYHLSEKYIIDLEDFQHISQAMPNVKYAKLPLTRSAFRKLCRVWPDLLTLTIPYRVGGSTRFDDEIITGIKPGPDPKGKRHPNITDLKNLTEFNCSGGLTDHSVYFGFLQLPRLHYLKVKFVKISKDAEAALRKKVNVLEARIDNNFGCSQ